jgi:hypothetical protein
MPGDEAGDLRKETDAVRAGKAEDGGHGRSDA